MSFHTALGSMNLGEQGHDYGVQSLGQATYVKNMFFHRGIQMSTAEVNSLISTTPGSIRKTHFNKNSLF